MFSEDSLRSIDGPALALGRRMSCVRSKLMVCLFGIALGSAAPALAQSSAPPATPPVQDEDLTQPVLMEPDYSLINLPTTLRLPVHKGDFHLTHRFQGNLANGSFGHQLGNLFGLDNGAVIGLEFRFSPIKYWQAAVYRNSLGKTFQFWGQYDRIRQSSSMPVSISPIISVEGTDNFSEEYAPALGAVISRTMKDRIALYAEPFWVHNTAPLSGETRDTFFIGIGGRLRIAQRSYIVGEVVPRAAGYAPADPEYSFGIETRVGGHVFSLVFQNGFSTTFRQLAEGGFPDSLYLGFNLSRKFW